MNTSWDKSFNTDFFSQLEAADFSSPSQVCTNGFQGARAQGHVAVIGSAGHEVEVGFPFPWFAHDAQLEEAGLGLGHLLGTCLAFPLAFAGEPEVAGRMSRSGLSRGGGAS